jgi:hypothetical protein
MTWISEGHYIFNIEDVHILNGAIIRSNLPYETYSRPYL